jgi:transposase InsO family protein
MKASLAVSALHNAIALREPAGTFVHSDRGSQFRSNALVRTLKGNGLKGSMGRVGACADNDPRARPGPWRGGRPRSASLASLARIDYKRTYIQAGIGIGPALICMRFFRYHPKVSQLTELVGPFVVAKELKCQTRK